MPATMSPPSRQTSPTSGVGGNALSGGRSINTRSFQVRTSTIDVEARTIEAVISTEAVVQVFDFVRFEIIDEILLTDGARLPDQVPLLESHYRWSTKDCRGSTRDLRKEAGQVVGTLHFHDDEDSLEVWGKYRDGHLTDLSIGYGYGEGGYTDIEPGQTETVNGKSYTAQKRILRIATDWKPKENSLVVIGADEDAKTREEMTMCPVCQNRHNTFNNTPGSALRISGNERGDTLASTLNGLIDGLVSDDLPRDQIITDMAEAAGIETGTVNQILDGEIDQPPRERLEGFATVLETDVEELITAAEADGADYSTEEEEEAERADDDEEEDDGPPDTPDDEDEERHKCDDEDD